MRWQVKMTDWFPIILYLAVVMVIVAVILKYFDKRKLKKQNENNQMQ